MVLVELRFPIQILILNVLRYENAPHTFHYKDLMKDQLNEGH